MKTRNDMKIKTYYNKKNMVDIICKSFVTLFLIVCCVIMTGCGNRNAVVTDYGNDKAEAAEDKNKEGMNLSSIPVSASGQNVREMLGADNIDWSERFEAGGLPVELTVKYTIPDLPSLDAFAGARIADTGAADLKDQAGDSAEAQVVKNVLGDSAKLVEEVESGTPVEELVRGEYDEEWFEFGNYYFAIHNAFDPFNKSNAELGYTDDQTLKFRSMDTDDFYIHIYEGKNDGVPARLIYGYSYKDQKQAIGFVPIYLAEYFQGEKEYVESYEYGEISHDLQVETTQDKMMEDKTNRCEMSDEELLRKTTDFLQNKLLIPVYDNMLSLNSKAAYISGYGDDKTQMLFTTREYWSDPDEVLCNGYKVYISQRLSGLFPASGLGAYLLNNSGSVVVTSKGVLSAYVVRQMDITDVTNNVQLLSADRIKECFLYAMQEQFDYLGKDYSDKKLYFTSLKLTYYPMPDPNNELLFTYIPAWEFTTTAQSKPDVIVYINGIDGTLIDVVD